MAAQSDETRRKVLEAAIAVFARKGYAGASIADILKGVGLSKPTLYYYFQNKAGLFSAILDFAFDEPFRLMQEAAQGGEDTEQKLLGVATALFGFCGSNRDLTRLALGSVFAAPEEIPADSLNPAKRRRNFEFVLRIIRDGQKRGELCASTDAAELAHGIYGSISHQIRMHLLTDTGKLDRRRAERIVALFLDGARSRS